MIALWDALYLLFFTMCGALVVLSVSSFGWRRLVTWGRPIVLAAVVAGIAGLAARSFTSGHLPIFGTFENAWTCAVSILVFCAVAPRLLGGAAEMWRWMSPWALAVMIYGSFFRREPVALTISEQSIFVDLHVVFAWAAFAALLCAATMSLLLIMGGRPAGDAEESQRIHDRLVLGGYVAFTAMLATGAFYLWILFATPWKWEIVGASSLLVWLGYGILIHGRLFYRWHGKGYHAGVLAVLPVLLLAFWVWSLYPGTYHFFDIPLVRPY